MLNKLGPGEDAVIPAEIERMYALCEKIVKEKDPQKFLALVSELNHLLAAKERRLEGDAASGRTP